MILFDIPRFYWQKFKINDAFKDEQLYMITDELTIKQLCMYIRMYACIFESWRPLLLLLHEC